MSTWAPHGTVAPQFAWLNGCARNNTSQYGENGIIDAIFGRIWPANKWCFECGAADGIFFSNTRHLIKAGWDAVLVEADHDAYRRLLANTDQFGPKTRRLCEKVDQVDPILANFGAPEDIDLVVLDTDAGDIHLFNGMLQYRPRVVVIEFDANATDPEFLPDIGEAKQAAATATARIAAGRFYTEVWRSWCNMVLVRQPMDLMLAART